MSETIESILPLLSYYGENDVAFFDEFDDEVTCMECGADLDLDGFCMDGCPKPPEDLDVEEFSDDFDDIRIVPSYSDDEDEPAYIR